MWRDVVIVAITAGVTWGSVCLTYWLRMKGDVGLSERDARLRGYTALMGLRRVVAQLYLTRFEAFIFSDYHEARWGIAGYPKDSLDFREAERWMHTSENLALEVARADQQLFEAVGTVRVVFPHSAKLMELTNAVYRHKVPTLLARGNRFTRIDELEAWQTGAAGQMKSLVRQGVEDPIDALIGHLELCIQADKRPWWSRLMTRIARRSPAQ